MGDDSKVVPLKGANHVDAASSEKLQCQVGVYAHYVVHSLIGYYGRSQSDVLSYIVLDWIRAHQEELHELGIAASIDAPNLVIEHGAMERSGIKNSD